LKPVRSGPFHFIPHPGHRDDNRWVFNVRFQLFSEPLDVYVHGTTVVIELRIPPDLLCDKITGKHFVGMGRKKFQIAFEDMYNVLTSSITRITECSASFVWIMGLPFSQNGICSNSHPLLSSTRKILNVKGCSDRFKWVQPLTLRRGVCDVYNQLK